MDDIIITLVNIFNGLASVQGETMLELILNFGTTLIAAIEAIFDMF